MVIYPVNYDHYYLLNNNQCLLPLPVCVQPRPFLAGGLNIHSQGDVDCLAGGRYRGDSQLSKGALKLLRLVGALGELRHGACLLGLGGGGGRGRGLGGVSGGGGGGGIGGSGGWGGGVLLLLLQALSLQVVLENLRADTNAMETPYRGHILASIERTETSGHG